LLTDGTPARAGDDPQIARTVWADGSHVQRHRLGVGRDSIRGDLNGDVRATSDRGAPAGVEYRAVSAIRAGRTLEKPPVPGA